MRARVPWSFVAAGFVSALLMSGACQLDRTGLSTGGGEAGGGGVPAAGGAAGLPVTTGNGGAGGNGGGSGGSSGAGGIGPSHDAAVDTGGAGGSSGGGAGGGSGGATGGAGGAGGEPVDAGARDAVVVTDANPPPADASSPDAGRPCGGTFGACPSLLMFCERPIGDCGGTGVCVPVPGVGTCPTTGPRVCGCDGHVYLNDCFRQQVRVSKENNGNCN